MAEQITEQQVVATYKSLRAEVRQMAEKISELEVETTEHDRVIQTLNELPKDRNAYRMVGGVLVQRSVQEVLPAVTSNRDGIAQVLAQLNESIKQKEKAADEWQRKYNIQVQSSEGRARQTGGWHEENRSWPCSSACVRSPLKNTKGYLTYR
ncbi:hypothetical protein PRNP1_003016 [Phytophthora ramorum]